MSARAGGISWPERWAQASSSVWAPHTSTPFDDRRLGHVGMGQQHAGLMRRARRESHRERTADGTEVALEANLAQNHLVAEPVFGQLAAGHQDAERDGEVER